MAKDIPAKKMQQLTSSLLNNNVKTIDIFCHTSPDEDTINAAKVMYNWLKKAGKKVQLCVDCNDTKDLYFDKSKYKIKSDNNKSDIALVLDFNSTERVPHQYSDILSKYSAQNIIGLDHHSKNSTSIKSNIYIDTSAHSCNGILVKFFNALKIKLPKKDLKSIFCGIVSDYKKSKYISIEKVKNKYIINKSEDLLKDKNSFDILDKITNSLNKTEQNEILKHLDVLSNLSQDEKELQEFIYSNAKTSPNNKLAYVAIPHNNEIWKKVGMDNQKTSAIMKDFRLNSLSDNNRNITTAITFYRPSADYDEYKMSVTSKNNQALTLINKSIEKFPLIQGGGHTDRAGCRINSLKDEDINKFISTIINSFEKID